MTTTTSFKAFGLCQVKAGPSDDLAEGEFTAYAATWTKDLYGDVIMPGAFAGTLADFVTRGLQIPLLFGHNMHDPDHIIGGIIEAREDETGLWVRGQFDLENPTARNVYRAVKGRRLNTLSFAYSVVEAHMGQQDGEDVRFLDELKIFEISLVHIPANPSTYVESVKSYLSGVKAGRVLSSKNESALRGAIDHLTEALASLKNVLAALGDEEDGDGKSAPEPPDSTPPATAEGPANDEEPPEAKSKEPSPASADEVLIAQLQIAQLT